MWMYLQVTFHECLAAEVYKCMSPTVDEYKIRKVLCDRISLFDFCIPHMRGLVVGVAWRAHLHPSLLFVQRVFARSLSS
tara:strand:- start:9368 stop:9604 length:237 start_codon:yes stop_codon:yes gene_type:complete